MMEWKCSSQDKQGWVGVYGVGSGGHAYQRYNYMQRAKIILSMQ